MDQRLGEGPGCVEFLQLGPALGLWLLLGFVLLGFQHGGLVPQLVLGLVLGLGLELELWLELVQELALELAQELGLVQELGLEVAQWLDWEDLWWLLGGPLVGESLGVLVGVGCLSCCS